MTSKYLVHPKKLNCLGGQLLRVASFSIANAYPLADRVELVLVKAFVLISLRFS